MKFIILILLVALFGFANIGYCQNDGAAEQLYPYKSGRLYGFCTKDKKMVIPLDYIMVESTDSFYLAYGRRGKIFVFNRKGNVIDSAYRYHKKGNGYLLLIAPYDMKAMYKVYDEEQRTHPYGVGDEHAYSPSRAWTIDSTGAKWEVPDTVVQQLFPLCVKLKNKDKYALYNMQEHKFLVPYTSDSIHMVRNTHIVTMGTKGCKAYDYKGNVYDLPLGACDLMYVHENGTYFETVAPKGKKSALYNKSGKLLFSGDKDWTYISGSDSATSNDFKIKLFQVTNPYTGQKNRNIVDIFDLNMKLVKRVMHVDYGGPNCVIMRVYDTTLPESVKSYAYNIAQNKYTLLKTTPVYKQPSTGGIEVPLPDANHLFSFIYVRGPNYTAYYNSYTAEEMFKLYDTFRERKPYTQHLLEIPIYHYENGVGFTRHYVFVRTTEEGPMTLYNEQNQVVPLHYDSVLPLRVLKTQFYKVKSGNKYGLINRKVEEIIAPMYDYMDFKNERFGRVTLGDKTFWIDSTGKRVFGESNFSYVYPYSVNGKWLALTYGTKLPNNWYENLNAAKAHIIDSAGNILDTWDCGERLGYEYDLTVDGKIIRYPGGNQVPKFSVQLYDPETKKVDSLAYPVYDILRYQNAAFLVQVANDAEEYAVYSAHDFSLVFPFAKCERTIKYSEVINTAPGAESGVLITPFTKKLEDANNTNGAYHLEVTGGFYSISGNKYWDEGNSIKK